MEHTLDPFALGGYEELSALLARRQKALDEMTTLKEDEAIDRAANVISDLDFEIAFRVAYNLSDLLGQARVLRSLIPMGTYYNAADTTLCDNIIVTLERLNKAPAPATLPADYSDIALIAAEQEMTALRAKQQTLWAAGQDADELHEPIGRKIGELGRFISTSEPATLVGAKVKLRYLADPEIGIAGGSCPQGTDVISVQQLHALVERLIANS